MFLIQKEVEKGHVCSWLGVQSWVLKVPVCALLFLGASCASTSHSSLCAWLQPCSPLLADASAAVPALISAVLSHVLVGAVQNGLRNVSGKWTFESFEGKIKYLMQASVRG